MRTSTSECHAQIHQQRPARGTSFRRLARHLLQRVVDEVRLLHRGAQRSQCATKCTQPIAPRIRPEDRHDHHGAAIFAQQSPTPAPRAPGPAVDDVPGAQNGTPPGSEPPPTSATMCAHRRASATRRSTVSSAWRRVRDHPLPGISPPGQPVERGRDKRAHHYGRMPSVSGHLLRAIRRTRAAQGRNPAGSARRGSRASPLMHLQTTL